MAKEKNQSSDIIFYSSPEGNVKIREATIRKIRIVQTGD